jgi:hypothetical protein
MLRHFPPGITLEYQRTNGEIETKSIDLLNLTQQTDIDSLVSQILFEEPMISEARRPQLAALITSTRITRAHRQNRYQSGPNIPNIQSPQSTHTPAYQLRVQQIGR